MPKLSQIDPFPQSAHPFSQSALPSHGALPRCPLPQSAHPFSQSENNFSQSVPFLSKCPPSQSDPFNPKGSSKGSSLAFLIAQDALPRTVLR